MNERINIQPRSTGRKRYSGGYMSVWVVSGTAGQERSTQGLEFGTGVQPETRRKGVRCKAKDYSIKRKADYSTNPVERGALKMIIDAFKKIFGQKTEDAMESRAVESRKKKMDDTDKEFDEAHSNFDTNIDDFNKFVGKKKQGKK